MPAAVLFDLGRGGEFAQRPDAPPTVPLRSTPPPPTRSCRAASGPARAPGPAGLKGGVGSASAVLDDGTTVAALVVLNAFGAALDERTGELLATRYGLGEEFAHVGVPPPVELAAARERAAAAYEGSRAPGMATTIGVVATDATLTKAQCQKVCGLGHDGLARAVHPVHTLLDGDTLFTLATGERRAPELPDLHALMVAAGECVTRAVGHAILAADSVDTGAVVLRSYRDAFPSAVRTGRRSRREHARGNPAHPAPGMSGLDVDRVEGGPHGLHDDVVARRVQGAEPVHRRAGVVEPPRHDDLAGASSSLTRRRGPRQVRRPGRLHQFQRSRSAVRPRPRTRCE